MKPVWAKGICVALDGPAGVGKTTTAIEVAGHLGLMYVDTGAMYRGLGMLALETGISPDDRDACEALALKARIQLKYQVKKSLQVIVNKRDMSNVIRTPAASDAASRISVHGGVRTQMVRWQRTMAVKGGVIMEGRDIGTVVLPGAQAKIFLTASVEERSRRRLKDLKARGQKSTLEAVIRDVEERDARDQGRDIAPLEPATDAVVLECTALSLEEQVARVLEIIEALVLMPKT